MRIFRIPTLSTFAAAIGLLAIQFVSLVRSYPSNPPCGKVVEISTHLNVLVNCDSAIFLKDSDNPARLFNGESNYVDRPLFSLLVKLIYKTVKILSGLNFRRTITGLSGETYSYSLIQFSIYILFNFLALLAAGILVVKLFEQKTVKNEKSQLVNVLILTNALFFVFANELTKTFFWTPHSQIFNVLIPVLAIYLVQNYQTETSPKNYLFSCLLILIGMFVYPAFGLLLTIQIFKKCASVKFRLTVVISLILAYLTYPLILRILGFQYNNEQIYKFREFIWLIDGLSGRSPWTIYFSEIGQFVASLPLIPSLISILTLLYLHKLDTNLFKRGRTQIHLAFVVLYSVYVLGLGLGERRVTLPILIYLGLQILLSISELSKKISNNLLTFLLSILLLIQTVSWVFTPGPLV